MPRVSLLTSEVEAKMVVALRAGAYAVDASRFAGINENLHYRWMRRGKAYEDLLDSEDAVVVEDPIEEKFYEYFRKCEQARAEAKIAAVNALATAIRDPTVNYPGWRPAVEFLRRTDPSNWDQLGMQRIGVELSGPGGQPVQVELAPIERTLTDRLRSQLPALRARLDAGDEEEVLDVEVVEDAPQIAAESDDDEDYMYAAWAVGL